MTKLKIALDVDGVLSNFYLGICKHYNQPYKSVSSWSVKWINEKFHKIVKDVDFWGNLETLNTPEAITFDFDCYLSCVPEGMEEVRKKWLAKKGFPDKPFYQSCDKLKKAQELGINVLIDDKPKTIKEFRRTGLIGIQYVPCYMPYTFDDFSDVFTIRHLADVKDILDKIIKREKVIKTI